MPILKFLPRVKSVLNITLSWLVFLKDPFLWFISQITFFHFLGLWKQKNTWGKKKKQQKKNFNFFYKWVKYFFPSCELHWCYKTKCFYSFSETLVHAHLDMRTGSTAHSLVTAIFLKPKSWGHAASSFSSAVLGRKDWAYLSFIRIILGRLASGVPFIFIFITF